MNAPDHSLATAEDPPTLSGSTGAQGDEHAGSRSIVLVHGAFVDGSGWRDVRDILTREGHEVTVVQNSTRTLGEDVAMTERAIAEATGEVILVGHSYGGAVISEAGNNPKVVGLVYIAAFVPDESESVKSMLETNPGRSHPPILPPVDGFLLLDATKFADEFAADVPRADADFMARSQVPWGVVALSDTVRHPAWKSKPAWYLVATDDRMIPPVAQRHMAARAGARVEDTAGSHAIYVSKPALVAEFIIKAARNRR